MTSKDSHKFLFRKEVKVMTLDIKIKSCDANGKRTNTKTFSSVSLVETDVSGMRQLILPYAALTTADTTTADLIKTTEIDLS